MLAEELKRLGRVGVASVSGDVVSDSVEVPIRRRFGEEPGGLVAARADGVGERRLVERLAARAEVSMTGARFSRETAMI